MDAARRFLGLAVAVAAEVGAVGVLHRLGALPWLQIDWARLGLWLARVPPEDALVAAARLVALAAAYWLLASTLAYVLARASRLPAAVQALEWATLPAVRRLADRALAVALAGSSMMVGLPAVATAAPVVVPPALGSPDDLPGALAAPAAGEAAGGDEQVAEPAQLGVEEPYVVVRGDNLWAIAAADLTRLGRATGVGDIRRHWQRIIERNRHDLRSGDPDRIYPGETIALPTVDDPPGR